ncbi:MAG: FKBP-type peptidyl-prolyl cis-trans isomerase [Ilumatobacteraceae bacterium]
MRRRLLPAASLICLAILASCGGDEKSSDATTGTTASSTASTGSGASAIPSTGSSIATPTIPSDCPAAETNTSDAPTPPSFPEGKPTVEVPTTMPTKLVVTDLTEGTGKPAEAGDIVNVNYVGVRSVDGTEFDNSYDRGQTFAVTLGAGSVIQGWDQGLVGIKAGGRRQLDIPADLAYGDNPSGDIIQAGDALTFIVDAVSITTGPPTANPTDAPKIDIPTSKGATKVSFTDLVDGERCKIALPGDSVFAQVILYRGDTGDLLQSTWTTGVPIELPLNDGTIRGIVEGTVGMGVGGRRQIIIPPDAGFGADGNTSQGLDPTTDLILIVDLISINASTTGG